jgi:hypothetical protein
LAHQSGRKAGAECSDIYKPCVEERYGSADAAGQFNDMDGRDAVEAARRKERRTF